MIARNILLLIFILTSCASLSQARRFQHLTTNDGISQSEIYSFFEDSNGFIWIGTLDGLNRYDGYSIKIYNTNRNDPHALSNNTIRCLAEDDFGRIWIGTDDGLNYFDLATEQFFQLECHSSEDRLTVLSLLVEDDYLLVGTTDGLWRSSIVSNSKEEIESGFHRIAFFNVQDSRNYIREIIRSKHGGIWVQNSSNISRIVFQQNSNEPVVIEDFFMDDFPGPELILEDSTGNLWIASAHDGLLRYDPGTKQTCHFTDYGTDYGPSSEKCSALTLDKNGNLWVGTLDKGLNFIKSEELNREMVLFEKVQHEPLNVSSLNSNLIYSLYVSEDNLLWVGTIGSGLNIYNPEQKKFSHYKFNVLDGKYAHSNFVRSVCVDEQNRILTGIHNSGLFIFDREKEEFRKLGFGTQSIYFISHLEGNKFFICTSSGIYLVELVHNTLVVLSTYRGFSFFNVVKGKPGFYWFATYNGLLRGRLIQDNIIIDTIYTKNTNPAISTNNCRVLYFNEESNELFVGTEGGGLNVISFNQDHYPDEIHVYKKGKELNSLSNNYVRSIVKDRNQNIWIGTYEGLNRMTRDSVSGEISFESYTRKDGLPNNMIQLIVEDDDQNLWLGTNAGLSHFNPDKHEFINYKVNDGIQSNEFSEHTAYIKSDGEIIMGGINGINAFYPEQIKTSSLKPQTTLTGFYLFNKNMKALEKAGKHMPLEKSITLTDSIILMPKQNSIGFEFSAMIYTSSEKIQYRYKLEGFDREWQFTDANRRIANYTNLRHGDYIFKVESTNSDGIWEETPREVFIRIKTPFIYTWYAYVIYTLFAILVFIYFSFYSVIRYTTKNKLLLEKEHNKKLHELDELRTKFFINISHDLRTPLTLIREPLDSILSEGKISNSVNEKLQLIKRNVKRLNYLVEQLLDVRKAESGTMNPKMKTEDLVSYTRNEVSLFFYAIRKKGLQLKVESDPDNISFGFDQAMISKVYFNVISNAIKYTDKGEIVIRIKRVGKEVGGLLEKSIYDSFVQVEIQDTGIGISTQQVPRIFDRFQQDPSNAGKGYGIGLSHTKELIEAHQGFIEAESTESEGTTIRFFLPYVEDSEKPGTGIAPSTEDIYFDTECPSAITAGLEKEKKDTILVVEDNTDMSNFLKSELLKNYNVIVAGDGLEGFKQAEEHLPDLIVSDVMMPNMDGIELCKRLKSNLDTSHIPLILLTAKVDLDSKYDGIETGADDWIPKPFEMKYLLLRIRNLLQSREQLRVLFQKGNTLDPSAVTVTSIDEKFLSMLIDAIEEGIPDSGFSVQSLESKLGMSHASFYRKIKNLTGQSGQELLQDMRMKRAYQILSEKKGLRVGEVAYMVGFTNPKYFSKCFKEMFGFAPSEFRR